jgi:hypothetical protein
VPGMIITSEYIYNNCRNWSIYRWYS